MSDEKKGVKIPQGKDFTKGVKPRKGYVKIKYSNHSSLTKNEKGRNPGDIEYVSPEMAKTLIKHGKAVEA